MSGRDACRGCDVRIRHSLLASEFLQRDRCGAVIVNHTTNFAGLVNWFSNVVSRARTRKSEQSAQLQIDSNSTVLICFIFFPLRLPVFLMVDFVGVNG